MQGRYSSCVVDQLEERLLRQRMCCLCRVRWYAKQMSQWIGLETMGIGERSRRKDGRIETRTSMIWNVSGINLFKRGGRLTV